MRLGSPLEGLWGRVSAGDDTGTLFSALGLGRAQGLGQEALVHGETLAIWGGTGIPEVGRERALGR